MSYDTNTAGISQHHFQNGGELAATAFGHNAVVDISTKLNKRIIPDMVRFLFVNSDDYNALHKIASHKQGRRREEKHRQATAKLLLQGETDRFHCTLDGIGLDVWVSSSGGTSLISERDAARSKTTKLQSSIPF